jgi:hypothetical protein
VPGVPIAPHLSRRDRPGRRRRRDCRCPECEYLDIVTTGKLAATVWVRRERRIRDALVRTVLELELDSVLGTPNPTVF